MMFLFKNSEGIKSSDENLTIILFLRTVFLNLSKPKNLSFQIFINFSNHSNNLMIIFVIFRKN